MRRPSSWIIAVMSCGAWLAIGGQVLSQTPAEKGYRPTPASSAVSGDAGTTEEDFSSQEGKANSPMETRGMPRSDVLRIVVSSGRCVGLTKSEAEAEMEKALTQQRAERLRRLSWDFARVRLSFAEVVQQWAWLLEQPGVEERVIDDLCEPREYGWVAERQVVIELPYQVLTSWTSRLQDRGIRRWQSRLLAAAGTILGTILAIVLAIVLDHRTGGYYRGVIVVGVFVTMGLLGAAFWIGLLWKVI